MLISCFCVSVALIYMPRTKDMQWVCLYVGCVLNRWKYWNNYDKMWPVKAANSYIHLSDGYKDVRKKVDTMV